MERRKKVFFTVGSLNQTTQMIQIANSMPDYDCYFSQFYSDSPITRFIDWMGWLDWTIMGGKIRENSENLLKENGYKLDYRGEELGNKYDLSILCTDLIVPKAAKKSGKVIWIQEGMIDPVTVWSKVVKFLKLPRAFTMGTSLNGSSNLCDVYCCASNGYADFFEKMGTDRKKLIVTGIPNYDNLIRFKDNDFPHKDYVMVATSDIRETKKKEDRVGFIKKCVKIANGRQLLFKLHPNENEVRAREEIRLNAPENTLVFASGDTNEMVANSVELITQYSTVVYVGMAFGIPIHSFFDVKELRRLMPDQNGGTSAQKIAHIANAFMEFEGDKKHFMAHYKAWCDKESVALQQGKNPILQCPKC